MATGSPLLTMERIDKTFPGVHALDHVDFDLYPGEVHILLGENGAGKSTLMKILSGSLEADSGRILVEGTEVRNNSPDRAAKLGIGMVYQEFSLVPTLTVAQNVFLDREARTRAGLSACAERERGRRIQLEADAEQPVGGRVSHDTRRWLRRAGARIDPCQAAPRPAGDPARAPASARGAPETRRTALPARLRRLGRDQPQSPRTRARQHGATTGLPRQSPGLARPAARHCRPERSRHARSC